MGGLMYKKPKKGYLKRVWKKKIETAATEPMIRSTVHSLHVPSNTRPKFKVELIESVQKHGPCVRLVGEGTSARIATVRNITVHPMQFSPTYKKLRRKYAFDGSVIGFWKFMHQNVGVHVTKEEMVTMLEEMGKGPARRAEVHLKMRIHGNGFISSSGCPYITILQCTNTSGHVFQLLSAEEPEEDTGALDPMTQKMTEVTDNDSVIFMHVIRET